MDKQTNFFSGMVLNDNSLGNVDVSQTSNAGDLHRAIELTFCDPVFQLLSEAALRLQPLAEQQSSLDTVYVSGVYDCIGFADVHDDLPEEPSSPPYDHGRVEQLFHMSLCMELEGLAELEHDAEFYESLPERRDIAVIDEDFEDEFLNVVAARVCSFSRSCGSNTASDQWRIQSLYDCNSLRSFEVQLQSGHAAKREAREEHQRKVASDKREKERKSVPKAERFKERKSQREIKDQIAVELQGFREIAPALAVGVLSGLAGRFLVKGAKAADAVTSIIEGFKACKNQMYRLLKDLWFVPLILILKHFLGQWKNAVVSAAIIAFIPKFFPAGLWSHISVFFPTGDVETQAGFGGIAQLLSVAFTFSVFNGKVSPSKVTEFCKRISTLDRMAKGWEVFITWTMTSLETLVNYVRGRFGKEAVELYRRSDRVAYEWVKTAESFIKEDSVGKELTPEGLDLMLKCLQEGYGLKELYRHTDVGKTIDATIGKLGSIAVPHLGSVASRNNFRFEPVTAFLYGLPGVGKTLMAVPFVAAILLKSGLIEDPTPDKVVREMWQKGTSEYWQGYDRQLAIIMDDAFQNRAFSGDKDNDYFNIIKMVGCFSMPLNFADLASKGKIFFGSKLVFGSTNLSSINAEAGIVIQEPEAVARRIKYGYQLFVDEEYRKDGKLDYDKFRAAWELCITNLCPGDDPLRAFPWHMWYVQNHNFLTGANGPERKSLASVIEEVSTEMRNRIRDHDVSKRYLDAMVNAAAVQTQSGRFVSAYKNIRAALDQRKREFDEDSSCVRRLLKVAVFAAGSFVAFKLVESILCGVCKLLSSVLGKKDPVLNSNRPLTKPFKPKFNKVVVQAGAFYSLADKVYANSYKMYNEDTNMMFGQVTFLCGELAVMPQHFREKLREGLDSGAVALSHTLCFRNCENEAHVVRFTVARFMDFDGLSDRSNDVEFVKFLSMQASKSVVEAFVTERDVKFVRDYAVDLHLCQIDDGKAFRRINKHEVYAFPSVALGYNLRVERDRVLERYYKYPLKTTQGDCGAILALHDPRAFGGRCVMGIHTAGDVYTTGGYSCVLTREQIDKAVQHFSVVKDKFEEDIALRGVQLQCGDVKPFDEMGSFLTIGQVNSPVFICPKTKYYKTELYETLGHYDCYPAILSSTMRDGERVWPMNNAVKPYSSPLLHLEVSRLNHIAHEAFKPFAERTLNNHKGLYTFDEAVLGIPQEKFRSIPRGTAAGFPYVLEVSGGKRAFFGEDQQYNLDNVQCERLRTRVSYVLESAANNERLSHVYVDFLKDELRPMIKIDNVATRLISSAPLDYVIAWRMMFGSFSSAIMRHNVFTGMAPGICAYSDWPRLAEHLSSKGAKVFDGDFKAFDSSEQPCVHNAILKAINAWYDDGPKNARIREVLWLDLVHSRHIGGRGDAQRFIYQWNKSLPSGHPFTTIVNSLYALVSLVACYSYITGDYRGFWINVAPLTYGDDNVVNVSDCVSEIYNQETVSAAMKELFHMTYTAGNKDASLKKYGKLEEATFLKRGFFFDGGRWLCPLELDSFLYVHYWCKNRKLEKQILISNLENSLEELSLQPQELWDKYASDIKVLLQSFGKTTNANCDRQSYLDLVLSRTEDWY